MSCLMSVVLVVVFPESFELEGVELLLAGFVAVVGFVAMRGGGATRTTALGYALVVLVAAASIVEPKNWLAGH